MTKEEIKNLLDKHQLTNKWKYLEPLLVNSIRITTKKVEEKELKIGQSKIGGFPDLPKSIEWFKWKEKPLSFIAQINLDEVKSFDIENKLPDSGILYFFYSYEQEAWGFDPKDKGCFITYYFDGSLDELERKEKPKDIEKYYCYEPCKLSFKSEFNIPDYQSNYFNIEMNDKEDQSFENFVDELCKDDYTTNKILGHSVNIQGGMELECELVTNGLYCGDSTGYNSPKAKELRENYKNWQLLLQIDSDDEADMMWGDSGCLYFWIKKEDLKNKKFENSWFSLQCC